MAISQNTAGQLGSHRRNRNCLPEIATGAKRPRNDKSLAFTVLSAVCTGRQHRCRERHAAPLQCVAGNFPLSVFRLCFAAFFDIIEKEEHRLSKNAQLKVTEGRKV